MPSSTRAGEAAGLPPAAAVKFLFRSQTSYSERGVGYTRSTASAVSGPMPAPASRGFSIMRGSRCYLMLHRIQQPEARAHTASDDWPGTANRFPTLYAKEESNPAAPILPLMDYGITAPPVAHGLLTMPVLTS